MNPCRCRPIALAFVALVALVPSAVAQLRLDLGTITAAYCSRISSHPSVTRSAAAGG